MKIISRQSNEASGKKDKLQPKEFKIIAGYEVEG